MKLELLKYLLTLNLTVRSRIAPMLSEASAFRMADTQKTVVETATLGVACPPLTRSSVSPGPDQASILLYEASNRLTR